MAAVAAIILAQGALAHAGELDRVNQRVNAMGLHETVDWGTGPIDGGCRLYAEEKRRELIADGMNPGRIALWAVSMRQGLHEVVVIDGQTVLDNLYDWPEKRSTLERSEGYVFLRRLD